MAAAKRKTIVYAKAKKKVGATGETRLVLKPTAKGKKAARSGKGKRGTMVLTVKGQFKPKQKGAKPVKVTKRLRILFEPAKRATAAAAQFDWEECDEPHPPFAAIYVPPTKEAIATLPPEIAAPLLDTLLRQPGQPGAEPETTVQGQLASQSFCAMRPKRCVSQARFCATNPHICREEPNVCYTDSTVCLISNHNFCARNATRCDGARVGRLIIWEYNYCDLSDGRACEAPEACEVNWKETKQQGYAFDCKPQTATRWPPGMPADGTPYEEAYRVPWKRGEYPWPPLDSRTGPRPPGGGGSESGEPERPTGTPAPPRPPLKIPPKKLPPGEPPPIGGDSAGGGGAGGCRFPEMFRTIWGECTIAY